MATHSLTGNGANNLFGNIDYSSDDYVIDGAGGNDTVEAGATSLRDFINLSRDGATARLAITPKGEIDDSVFNMTNVENVLIHAGQGGDVVDIGDLTGLGINRVTVDLAGIYGGGDGTTDDVSVDATSHADSIRVNAVDGVVTVTGLPAELVVTGAEAAIDALHVYAGDGNDVIDASGVYGLKPSASGFLLYGDAGNDLVIGSTGGDWLYGGAGVDTLIGGAGNDSYVNPLGDTIVEQANGGVDTVWSGLTFSLEGIANVERLTLTGVRAIDGTGNELANRIEGNDANNSLRGLEGDDLIIAGKGADTLDGGTGVDILVGGKGRDTIMPGDDDAADIVRFVRASDSTGAHRDVVVGMNLDNEDLFDVPVMPTSVSQNIDGGVLREAYFNADLASAVSGSLEAHGAVLFDPSSGSANYDNTAYLVVDINGVAGYQNGEDLVVQLQNWTGSLDLTDFI